MRLVLVNERTEKVEIISGERTVVWGFQGLYRGVCPICLRQTVARRLGKFMFMGMFKGVECGHVFELPEMVTASERAWGIKEEEKNRGSERK